MRKPSSLSEWSLQERLMLDASKVVADKSLGARGDSPRDPRAGGIESHVKTPLLDRTGLVVRISRLKSLVPGLTLPRGHCVLYSPLTNTSSRMRLPLSRTTILPLALGVSICALRPLQFARTLVICASCRASPTTGIDIRATDSTIAEVK